MNATLHIHRDETLLSSAQYGHGIAICELRVGLDYLTLTHHDAEALAGWLREAADALHQTRAKTDILEEERQRFAQNRALVDVLEEKPV